MRHWTQRASMTCSRQTPGPPSPLRRNRLETSPPRSDIARLGLTFGRGAKRTVFRGGHLEAAPFGAHLYGK